MDRPSYTRINKETLGFRQYIIPDKPNRYIQSIQSKNCRIYIFSWYGTFFRWDHIYYATKQSQYIWEEWNIKHLFQPAQYEIRNQLQENKWKTQTCDG